MTEDYSVKREALAQIIANARKRVIAEEPAIKLTMDEHFRRFDLAAADDLLSILGRNRDQDS